MSTYYERNRETVLAKQRLRNEQNKEQIAAYQREYRALHAKERKKYHADYYAGRRDEMKAAQAVYYADHREYYHTLNQAYYLDHTKELKDASKQYYHDNREQLLIRKQSYYRSKKSDFIRRNAGRRAQEKQATPKWANKLIMSVIYKDCVHHTQSTNVVHHVHHIIPLRDHPNVCGLHCEANLLIMTHEDHKHIHNGVTLVESLW